MALNNLFLIGKLYSLQKLMERVSLKKRPPETLKCSKSKTWRPRKLKLHRPVYLII